MTSFRSLLITPRSLSLTSALSQAWLLAASLPCGVGCRGGIVICANLYAAVAGPPESLGFLVVALVLVEGWDVGAFLAAGLEVKATVCLGGSAAPGWLLLLSLLGSFRLVEEEADGIMAGWTDSTIAASCGLRVIEEVDGHDGEQ